LDLAATLRPLRCGPRDPSLWFRADGVWRATRTPCGPGVEHLRLEGDRLRAEAWGPGAEWLLERVPELIGELDDDGDFQPEHPLLRDLCRLHRGLRIGRGGAVFEAAVAAVLEQRVTNLEAFQAWRGLLFAFGEPAPGPHRGILLPPAPEVLARVPSHILRGLGVELRRWATLRQAALVAHRLEETLEMPLPAARRRLAAVPGLGPWSVAKIGLAALGDADAVPVGDHHLPHLVSWALAGEVRGSDERMLELLEPYRGHRGRVLRLLLTAGLAAPRHGPPQPRRRIDG
jgi:3-methyladenine DNA glycosylase/8-oxoguanine DNA glycosylase